VRHTVPAAAAGAFAGRCIAVVDDEPAAIEGVRALFESCGASVVGAASGDALLDALGELGSYPDLLIADYRLGNGETGTDVIARVRDELGIRLPAVLVSRGAQSGG
jgi:CheY-like chemotaxis protein